jgi:hypothetical protein
VNRKKSLIAVALVATAVVAGCASQDPGSVSAEDRGSSAVEGCRAHGGVVAFEDEVVICRDNTVPHGRDRGSTAVDACRGHRGVSAFDDDVVICRDQTFQKAKGG